MSKEDKKRIVPLDIRSLIGGETKYIIPVYQRNYSWKSKEIEQLILDVSDYSKTNPDSNYYIGTLVVAERDDLQSVFDTIDGQQRLTTLFILTAAIKQQKVYNLDWFNTINLSFESRSISDRTLGAIFCDEFQNDVDYEVNIKAAFDICKNIFKNKKIKDQGISIDAFADYLYNYVKILRVTLPENTDLNRYFEIMNNRGEQLEKHEVLKAKLMACFNQSKNNELYAYCFNLVWEACENMERYVQYGFTPSQRHLIFGAEDWDNLSVNSFDELVNKIVSKSNESLEYNSKGNTLNIDEIINSENIQIKSKNEEDVPERFNSVISFPNFLLHILKIQTENENVALDDKRLIDVFDFYLRNKSDEEKLTFAKEFIFNLLKSKFLFDKYIIKREITANTDGWTLKSLIRYSTGKSENNVKYLNTFGKNEDDNNDDDNRRILMLLSMFHVSIPSQSYKYWLFAALRYVFHQEELNSAGYIKYLEHIAKSFVFDRFLADDCLEYDDMIIKQLNPVNRNPEKIALEKLNYSAIENNLLFNFTDYLLWMELKNTDDRIKKYKYTFRSSVEHYYPQNPLNKEVDLIEDQNVLHSFGNLCLISHEKNSRLSNLSPTSKKEHYNKSDALDSIKQYIMMNEKWNIWDTDAILRHEKEMIELLRRNMNSDFKWVESSLSKAQTWYKRYKNENKQLLIRAIMSFGQVDYWGGWTSGMEKWNFYQWDKIESSESFRRFENYVNQNNPDSLEKIIESNLIHNAELRLDSYRYSFVSRPYIIDYCEQGNYGWGDEKRILLLRTNVASRHNSRDLYCHCLSYELQTRHNINSYIDYELVKFSLAETEDTLILTNYVWNSPVTLNIWNDSGNICYEIEAENIHGNSKTIKNLKDKGWSYDNKKLRHPLKKFLVTLTDDVENNITNSIFEFSKILQLL